MIPNLFPKFQSSKNDTLLIQVLTCIDEQNKISFIQDFRYLCAGIIDAESY